MMKSSFKWLISSLVALTNYYWPSIQPFFIVIKSHLCNRFSSNIIAMARYIMTSLLRMNQSL